MTSIKLRKAIPIIGTISSGKSLFLDNLLGLDLLETNSSTTTKFVCVIRHKKDLEEPIFYHINLIKKGNVYESIKEGDIVIGKEKIRKKIKEINDIEKEISDDKRKYDQLFYILEIDIKTIKNEELLNNYDFYDIPGLDELINNKEQDNNKNNNNNNIQTKVKMIYIKELFKYFKNIIDFGIFVINSERGYVNSSKEVIVNVVNEIKREKNITNYLIILNKIDKQAHPEKAINAVKSDITNNLLGKVNLFDNVFIPLDARQIKHQRLLSENFENLLFFLINQYVVKSIIPFIDNEERSEEEKKFKTEKYSFYDFLIDFISKGKDKDDIEEYIDEMEEKFDESYDFKDIEAEKIFENIKKEQQKENYYITYKIDLEDDESIKLFKCLYMRFKSKENLPFSKEVNEVYNYFENKCLNNEDNIAAPITIPKIKPLTKEQQFLKQFEGFKKKFNVKSKELKEQFNIITSLNKTLEQLYYYLLSQQIVYIGIFGSSSTGKSLIYNNLFGNNILTVNSDETTRRGIIVEDDENIALYTVETMKNNLNGMEYIYFKKGQMIADNEKDVKEYLSYLNKQFAKDTDNKKLEYFLVTLPIKFFDEIKLDKEIRKKIKFIDIPGYNTKASIKFDYSSLIESISCFLINFNSESIASTDNKTSIYDQLRNKSKRIKCISDNDFLKNCLFIVNIFKNDDPPETKINAWMKNIKNLVLNRDDEENINFDLTYFRAGLYKTYLEKSKYYIDYQYLFDEILHKYKKKKTFFQFFAEEFKINFKEFFKLDSKKIKEIIANENDKDIYTEIDKLFNDNSEKIGLLPKDDKNYQKYLSEICSYLSYAKKNIKNISYYID